MSAMVPIRELDRYRAALNGDSHAEPKGPPPLPPEVRELRRLEAMRLTPFEQMDPGFNYAVALAAARARVIPEPPKED